MWKKPAEIQTILSDVCSESLVVDRSKVSRWYNRFREPRTSTNNRSAKLVTDALA